MRRRNRVFRVLVFVLMPLSVLGASCGGAATSGDTSDTEVSVSSVTTVVSTTSTVAPTTSTTTSVTVPPTTTTTTPPSSAELRTRFLQLLDDRGWVTYTDEVIGWSVRYPSDWVVIEQTPGDNLILATPKQEGLFLLSPALDADDVDESSGDYLRGGVGFSVADGLLREPDEDAWFWYDHDFDGEHGALDIDGVATSLAVSLDGSPLSDDEKSPVWWFGYYDPDSRPGYGYVMQTIGLDPVLFQWLDDIVLSFEPQPVYVVGEDPVSSGVSAANLLEVGDCLLDPGDDVFEDVQTVDCASAHDFEVFQLATLPGSSFPTDTEFEDAALQYCLPAFDGYTGENYDESDLWIGFFVPDERAWSSGDRIMQCYLYLPGEMITGSQKTP